MRSRNCNPPMAPPQGGRSGTVESTRAKCEARSSPAGGLQPLAARRASDRPGAEELSRSDRLARDRMSRCTIGSNIGAITSTVALEHYDSTKGSCVNLNLHSGIEALRKNIAIQKRLRAELEQLRSVVENGLIDQRTLVFGLNGNSSPAPFDWWKGPVDEAPELQRFEGSPPGGRSSTVVSEGEPIALHPLTGRQPNGGRFVKLRGPSSRLLASPVDRLNTCPTNHANC